MQIQGKEEGVAATIVPTKTRKATKKYRSFPTRKQIPDGTGRDLGRRSRENTINTEELRFKHGQQAHNGATAPAALANEESAPMDSHTIAPPPGELAVQNGIKSVHRLQEQLRLSLYHL